MEQYVALDVSLKEISVCVIDAAGAVVFEGKSAAEPALLIKLIQTTRPEASSPTRLQLFLPRSIPRT
ncbi:hypothetical protein [Teichococcus vastitatis]|uniref:hypothetical protein n=1 Tax=Teichococcus vastitatis TaxID=2307076 RepID=UPI0038CF8D38